MQNNDFTKLDIQYHALGYATPTTKKMEGGHMVSAPGLDLTTSLQGDSVDFGKALILFLRPLEGSWGVVGVSSKSQFLNQPVPASPVGPLRGGGGRKSSWDPIG